MSGPLLEYLLRLGDTTLILGHRLGEWCGHAPTVEEDIALANTALDLVGQTRLWLGLASVVENRGRDADALAYRRDAWEFRNLLIAELPNVDYGRTILRQFLYDAYALPLLERLGASSERRVAEIAIKAAKETAYHLDRSSGIVIGLGDGTPESHARMQAALDALWPYAGEMLAPDAVDDSLAAEGAAPDLAEVRREWTRTVEDAFVQATLVAPEGEFAHRGGKTGRHTEHLGHLLAEMQFLQRAYPGATW